MCLCRFSCFVRGFTTIQEFKHTKNRDAFICNSCLAAFRLFRKRLIMITFPNMNLA